MGRIPQIDERTGELYKSPKIQHLWPHHLSMARMVAAGTQPNEVARLTGFSAGQVSRIMGTPAFQAEVDRLRENAEDNLRNVTAEIQKMSERAVEILDEEMNREAQEGQMTLDEKRLRFKAAVTTLEMAGHKRSGPQSQSIHLHQHEEKHIHEMESEDIAQRIFDMISDEE